MNITCFYDQTPFTLSMEEKVAALRKMHAENLHHYDARCPRCGRANAISRERLEMFTPGWEEAIKAPAGPMTPQTTPTQAPVMPAPAMPKPAARKAGPSRRKHAPAAKKVAKKSVKKVARKTAKAKAKPAKKKAVAKKAAKKSSRTRARRR
jgi:hypothetical protein